MTLVLLYMIPAAFTLGCFMNGGGGGILSTLLLAIFWPVALALLLLQVVIHWGR